MNIEITEMTRIASKKITYPGYNRKAHYVFIAEAGSQNGMVIVHNAQGTVIDSFMHHDPDAHTMAKLHHSARIEIIERKLDDDR